MVAAESGTSTTQENPETEWQESPHKLMRYNSRGGSGRVGIVGLPVFGWLAEVTLVGEMNLPPSGRRRLTLLTFGIAEKKPTIRTYAI